MWNLILLIPFSRGSIMIITKNLSSKLWLWLVRDCWCLSLMVWSRKPVSSLACFIVSSYFFNFRLSAAQLRHSAYMRNVSVHSWKNQLLFLKCWKTKFITEKSAQALECWSWRLSFRFFWVKFESSFCQYFFMKI